MLQSIIAAMIVALIIMGFLAYLSIEWGLSKTELAIVATTGLLLAIGSFFW